MACCTFFCSHFLGEKKLPVELMLGLRGTSGPSHPALLLTPLQSSSNWKWGLAEVSAGVEGLEGEGGGCAELLILAGLDASSRLEALNPSGSGAGASSEP